MSEMDNTAMQESMGGNPGIKLDVNVRPITPKNNLLAFASVRMNDCFVVDGIKIVAGEKGLFVDMPSSQDSKGVYHDICFPITADFREKLQAAVLEGYAAAVDKVHAVGTAQREFTEKPGIMEQLRAGKEKAAERAAAMPQREAAAKTPGPEL
jgi:stage V sporulation protein G